MISNISTLERATNYQDACEEEFQRWELVRNTAAYYQDLTRYYMKYAPGTSAWHYGVWRPQTRSLTEAIEVSNQRLLERLVITANTQLLDVGCGAGGFAVWAAKTFGCQVTGITVCPDHIRMARHLAQRTGVEQRCRFLLMDLQTLGFADGSFDVVVNQESFCYAADKLHAAASVKRVLRPGGAWCAVEFGLADGTLDAEAQAWYRAVRAGYYIPSLLSAQGIRTMLQRTGFVRSSLEDLTTAVAPTARDIIRRCWIPLSLSRVGLDWLMGSRQPRVRANHQGHFEAAAAYSRGLLRGCFRHYLYRAYVPAASDAEVGKGQAFHGSRT